MSTKISFEHLYDSIDSAYLDCYSVNLAVLLASLGIEDTRAPFAHQWYFDFDPARNEGLPLIMDRPIEDVIRQQTGCVTLTFSSQAGHVAADCCALLDQYGPFLVLGDAFLMPWLPYFGHEHMVHSFIIVDLDHENKLFHIVDAYNNKTEWGAALPCSLSIPMLSVEGMLMHTEDHPLRVLQKLEQPSKLPVPSLLQQQAMFIVQQAQKKPALLSFCQYYRQQVDDIDAVKRFCLACWLVARQRALHHLWLGTLATTPSSIIPDSYHAQFQQLVSNSWQKLTEFSYLLLRRIKLGRKPIDSCFQLLEEVIAPSEIQAANILLHILQTTEQS